ncbi:hypothetical protein ACH5RR_036245 [Cinchona calisaya]|uniref:Uncharacterized protein n=1 Tax=Cinchona calisaya TaxID=153742 RepID=A0ABD2Y447_9GENT
MDSTDHELVNRLKSAVVRTGDCIEDGIMDHPVLLEEMKHIMELPTRPFRFETTVKEIFCVVNDINQWVTWRSEEVYSIQHPLLHPCAKGEDLAFGDFYLDRASELKRADTERRSPLGERKKAEDIDVTDFQLGSASQPERSWEMSLKQKDVVVGLDDDLSKFIYELPISTKIRNCK